MNSFILKVSALELPCIIFFASIYFGEPGFSGYPSRSSIKLPCSWLKWKTHSSV